MFRSKEVIAGEQTKRNDYLRKLLGPAGESLIVDNAEEQKKIFQKEAERLGELVDEVGGSAQVAGDCNKLLADANILIKAAGSDKYAVIAKFDKVKQRLIRAYDSRAALSGLGLVVTIYNFALLIAIVYFIGYYGLIPGHKNLESTAYVIFACAMWGGVGSIVDAFFALHTHLANQDFDEHYWPWYWTHPICGFSMGAVIYLILAAGLLTMTGMPLQEAASANATAGPAAAVTGRIGATALPIVLAFLAGFRQRTAVDFFTRTIAAIFKSEESKKDDSGK